MLVSSESWETGEELGWDGMGWENVRALMLLGGADIGNGDAEGVAVGCVQFQLVHDVRDDLVCLKRQYLVRNLWLRAGSRLTLEISSAFCAL